jgi:uncharacterized protein YndB with AHSA1/START domain
MTSRCAHFQLNRDFPLSPDRMWSLLTDPKARELWGAPSDDAVLVLETADLQEGGHERHRCGPAEDPEFVVDTHWYHLDTPNLACFTETISAGGTRFAVTLVTYALVPSDKGCSLTVDVGLSALTEGDMVGDFKQGWTSGLDRLERFIGDGTLT